jgi:prevent-host-death family protein
MTKVITIYDAKTNLSKYIKQAKAGQPVYIGSYGEREVVLMAAKPAKAQIVYGTAAGQIQYTDEVLDGCDPDVQAMFYGESEPKS